LTVPDLVGFVNDQCTYSQGGRGSEKDVKALLREDKNASTVRMAFTVDRERRHGDVIKSFCTE
jgi:hypothetical protein